MCGIAGIYNFKRADINKKYINWCISTMKHRGPDDQQVWTNGENYIAGFVRLAIQDTSQAANQPFFSNCGNYCITYNGEIYNKLLLKEKLKPYSIQYKSNSDTEVFLYAIIHLGIEKTLEITDGIFAFAFYNIRENKLILARDRMGVKPLYIGIAADCIIYSSQYDHIINFPPLAFAGLSESAVAAYFSLGYIPENAGAYQNTKMLLHGHYYAIDSREISEHQYYEYPLLPVHQNEKAIDEILDQSIASQLISDVPLGTFMSGGVDSTLVTYFAKKQMDITSFTIGSHDKIYDETDAAAQYAKIFGVININRCFDNDEILHAIEDNVKAYSEPFADYSSLPMLMLSKLAREQVTVALSGDGGDELFFGYWKNKKVFDTLKYYASGSKSLRRIKLLWQKLHGDASADISRHWNEENFLSYCYHSLYITGALHYAPRILNNAASEAWWYQQMKKHFNDTDAGTQGMYALRKLELDVHMQRMLLKVDRAGMYHSLEIRVPLLSNTMLQYSSNLDFQDCFKNGIGKINLKESLFKKANKELVMAPKKGFDIPINQFIRGSLKNEFQEKILDMPSSIAYLFNRKEVEKCWVQHTNEKHNAGWLLWAIYSFVRWHAQHTNCYSG